MTNFELGPIRPPDEANSLLIRATRGCSWNRCHFCTLFKGARFSIRPVDDIKQDIAAAQHHYQGIPFERCFLQDGDSFAMRTHDLLDILQALKDAFPSLKRISSYGRAQSMARKSEVEMQELYDAGLNMLYCGVESGSDKVLDAVGKGVSSDTIIHASLKAQQAGMRLMVFVILGLGGRELSYHHVDDTAKVLNRIDPDTIRIMSLAVKRGTAFMTQIEQGSFSMLSEVEMIEEQRGLIERLNGIRSRYVNYHGINLLTEAAGTLPDDKAKLLATIDRFLSLNDAAQLNFILGRRLGCYQRLSYLENSDAYYAVQRQLEAFSKEHSDSYEALFHDLRNRVI